MLFIGVSMDLRAHTKDKMAMLNRYVYIFANMYIYMHIYMYVCNTHHDDVQARKKFSPDYRINTQL